MLTSRIRFRVKHTRLPHHTRTAEQRHRTVAHLSDVAASAEIDLLTDVVFHRDRQFALSVATGVATTTCPTARYSALPLVASKPDHRQRHQSRPARLLQTSSARQLCCALTSRSRSAAISPVVYFRCEPSSSFATHESLAEPARSVHQVRCGVIRMNTGATSLIDQACNSASPTFKLANPQFTADQLARAVACVSEDLPPPRRRS